MVKPKPNKTNLFSKVYEVVKRIPGGKVMTYGQIALRLSSGSSTTRIKISPQFIGWALHANPDGSIVPCHRVVNKDGRLAHGYVFGGPNEQKMRLLSEGVIFTDKDHVDLQKCQITQ